MALRAVAREGWSFHGLAFLRVGNRQRPTFRDRLVTAFGVVGAIAADADADDDLIGGNLVEHARQYLCITGGVVSHFDGPDFQDGRVISTVDLSPLATVVCPALFGPPLAFAQYLMLVLSVRRCSPVRRTRLNKP